MQEGDIMSEIVTTNVVASLPLERRLTGTPTTHAKITIYQKGSVLQVENKQSTLLILRLTGQERATQKGSSGVHFSFIFP